MRSLSIALFVLLAFLTVTGAQLWASDMAPAAAEAIYVSVDAGEALPHDTLYRINPDGSGQTKVFDFSGHPKDQDAGIWSLRAAPDGYLYFASDNSDLYTPASRNLFRVRPDGSGLDAITSSNWNQPCPCGTVTGFVHKSAGGAPYSNAPVYLDGVGMVNSGTDGSFRFDNVPTGARWIVAYRPGDVNVYDAKTITVNEGSATDVQLIPNSSGRMGFEHPAPSGDRIYYRFTNSEARWTDLSFSQQATVYSALSSCSDITQWVDGLDVGPKTGRLAIVDYQTGCGVGSTEHAGVYLADKDGGNRQFLVNMYQDSNWQDAGEIFWSPDESRLAWKATYQDPNTFQVLVYLIVLDASTGQILSNVFFPQGYTIYNVSLHGWSPDGKWLLFSSNPNDPSQGTLAKVPVAADGSLDSNGVVNLMTNTRISGATWAPASVSPTATPTSTPTSVSSTATPTSTPTSASPTATPTSTPVPGATDTPTPTPTATPRARIYLPGVQR